jgi:preprotein translocase subunit SecG
MTDMPHSLNARSMKLWLLIAGIAIAVIVIVAIVLMAHGGGGGGGGY